MLLNTLATEVMKRDVRAMKRCRTEINYDKNAIEAIWGIKRTWGINEEKNNTSVSIKVVYHMIINKLEYKIYIIKIFAE